MYRSGKRFFAVVALICLLTFTAAAAGSSVSSSLPMGGNILYLEMGPGRTGEVTLANGRLFQAQPAAGHVNAKASEGGKNVVASINGGYFDSYSGGNQVYATIIRGGEVINGGGEKPTLVFTSDGRALIDRVKIETKIELRNEGETAITVYAVNSYSADNTWASALITPDYGRALTVAPDARVVTIEQSVITGIRTGGTIPALNWGTTVLVINSSAWNNLAAYYNEPQVGNAAIRKTVYTPQHDPASEWTNIVNGVGAGPLLLKDGADVCDQNADFTDPKQSVDYVSARSFAAIMGDGRLAIGSATSASMRALAQYLKGQGAVDAIALDGGASTYLSYNGSTLHTAGRNLANVLHIVDYASGVLPQGVRARDFDSPSDWAQSTISAAVSEGLVPAALQSGYQKNITREEFCQLIGALLRKQMSDYDSKLYSTGVTYEQARAALTDSWDIDVINAYRLGIIDGVGGNRFDPNGSLTREQAAKILMGADQLIGERAVNSSPISFADAKSISSWATGCVDYVVLRGIMNGSGENFEPQEMFTREQAIATIYRML